MQWPLGHCALYIRRKNKDDKKKKKKHYLKEKLTSASVIDPPQSPSLAFYIRSEGCEDPGKQKDTCGIAYIFVAGVDRSLHKRGHNVVIVDAETGE